VGIQPVSHKTLAAVVAGKLAASLLDGTFEPGQRLPPERELMELLSVSRATLREGLKALGEYKLIEAQAGVGWFARAIDESNMAQARELAGSRSPEARPPHWPSAPPGSPRETPAHPESAD